MQGRPPTPQRGVDEWVLLALLLAAFALPRLFVATPTYLVSMDEAKYLALAKSFPYHTLFDNRLYLTHPPLFPYAIRALSVLMPDHIAGISVSLLSALVALVAMCRLFWLLGRDDYWLALALLPLIVSALHIPTSNVIYKDSMYFGLFSLTLYLYAKGLIRGGRLSFALAALSGAACFLTSDLALSLVPCLGLAFLAFRRPGALLPAAVSGLVMLLPFGAWLGVKAAVFHTHELYPVGVDGLVEHVRTFTPMQLFNPRFFPNGMTLFDFGLDVSRSGIHKNVYPLYSMWAPVWFMRGMFAVVLATAVLGTLRACIARKPHGDPTVFFTGMLVLFAAMIPMHPEPRFMIPILIPISFLFAEGVDALLRRIPARWDARRWIGLGTAILLAATALTWARAGRHLVFGLAKEVESQQTAAALAELPGDGIMAQIGYPPELVYLTGKRVMALPTRPEDLDRFIDRFDIDYLVYGQHYWGPIDEAPPDAIWCYDTIRYIRDHPERYPLIAAIDETLRSKDWPDRVFIHAARPD